MICSRERTSGTVPGYSWKGYTLMTSKNKPEQSWELLTRRFSAPRMEPYLIHSNGDLDLALDLFEWNTEISLQIWEIIALLEVALKNTLDYQLSRWAKREQCVKSWIYDEKNVLKGLNGQKGVYVSIQKTMKRLENQNIPISQDSVVAGLGLEFWVNLISKRYLFVWPTLIYGFPNLPQRNQLNVHETLQDILRIRNRIAHHDRVWRLNLDYYLESLCSVAAFIDWDFYDYIQPQVSSTRTSILYALGRFKI